MKFKIISEDLKIDERTVRIVKILVMISRKEIKNYLWDK